MRYNKLLLLILAFLVTLNSNAAEQIPEPHAMLYFQVPLGGGHKAVNKPVFGFRMDQVVTEPGKIIDYPELLKKEAVFDLKFGHDGVESLKISGIDYLAKYRLLRQNGDEETAVTETGDTEEAGEESSAGEDENKLFKLPSLSNVIEEDQYVGLMMGGVLLLVLLIGVGP